MSQCSYLFFGTIKINNLNCKKFSIDKNMPNSNSKIVILLPGSVHPLAITQSYPAGALVRDESSMVISFSLPRMTSFKNIIPLRPAGRAIDVKNITYQNCLPSTNCSFHISHLPIIPVCCSFHFSHFPIIPVCCSFHFSHLPITPVCSFHISNLPIILVCGSFHFSLYPLYQCVFLTFPTLMSVRQNKLGNVIVYLNTYH